MRRAAPALRDAAEWLGHAFHERWLLACGVAHYIGPHHGKLPCAIAAVIVDNSGSLPGATGVECRGALRETAAEIRSDSVSVLVEDATLPDAAESAADGLTDEIAIKGRGSTDFHAGLEWLDDQRSTPGVCLPLSDRACSSDPDREPSCPTIRVNRAETEDEWCRAPRGERIDMAA